MAKRALVFVGLIVLGTVLMAGPRSGCSSFSTEIPVESSVASSKVWSNLLRQPESVSAESERLLADAERRVETARPPADLCPSYCSAPAHPQIVFSTKPTVFLDQYDQADKCEKLLQNTSESPFVFDLMTFDSIDQLNRWVQDFTRGRGREGQELYRRCDGKCSPQYLWTIWSTGERLTVETAVTCGHARDRGVNRYELASSLRWVCGEP